MINDFNPPVVSFIASQILGDGSFRKDGSGILSVAHTRPQFDYLTWKAQIASGLNLKVSLYKPRLANSSFGIYEIQEAIVWLKDLAWVGGLSAEELVDKLDPFGLLLWWLDDGCMVVHEKKNGTSVSRFGYLGTEAFDKETNQRLSSILFAKFGLLSAVHIDRGGVVSPDAVYYRLYFNATAMRQFIDIVRPWLHLVPASVKYKFNMQYRPTRLSTSEEYTRLYNF